MIKRCNETIADMVSSYKSGNIEARERLIFLYLDSARKIAKDYYGLGVEEEDLIQAAYEGLVVAVDECQNKELKNYSQQIIRRIEDAVRLAVAQKYISYSGGRHCNSYTGGMAVSLLKLKRDIVVKEGRVPSNEELGKKLNVFPSLVNHIFEELDRNCGNIADLNSDDICCVMHSVQDVEFEMQYDYDKSHLSELVRRKIDEIPFSPAERRLLGCIQHGILDLYEQKDSLKISRQRVCELRKSVTSKLRRAMLKELGEFVDKDSSIVAYESERVFINRRKRDRAQNKHRY